MIDRSDLILDIFASRAKTAQAKIKETLGGNSHVTLHSYAGQNHAFARAGGEHYDKKSADLANERTAAFFKKYLWINTDTREQTR